MSSHVSQRIRTSFQNKQPVMDRPDDSPTRSLREARRSSMPMPIENHPQLQQSQSQPQPQSLPQQPQSQPQPQPPGASSSASLPPFPRRRSSPLSHPLLMDDPKDSAINSNHQQQQQQQQQPRSIQRVPPPPLSSLVESDQDNRYSTLRNEWSLTDQYLDMDHRHNIHDSGLPSPNQASAIAAANAAPSSAASIPMPKGPIIERQKDPLREPDVAATANGASGPVGSSRRSDSLRRATRPPLPQPPQTKTTNESPPPPLSNQSQSHQLSPQRPSLYSDRSSSQTVTLSRGSPTYGVGVDSQPLPQQQQPSPSHKRDNSPPFRYDERERDRERSQPTAKARTPDRSLPVQEENEAEEDDTIKPSPPLPHSHSHPHIDRVREREREALRERDRQRERERDRELDSETIKPRQLGHRLPTPQFGNSGDAGSTSPGGAGAGGAGEEDVSTTIIAHGEDEYADERDGRSSRAGHRYEEEEEEEISQGRRAPTQNHDRGDNNNGLAQQQQPDIEEQEDTETYTPRSPPASLPPYLVNTANANSSQAKSSSTNSNNNDRSTHSHDHSNNDNNNNSNSNNAERIMYQYHNINPSLSHLHFRPRTASSDAGGMPNLDAAVLQHPFVADYNYTQSRIASGNTSAAARGQHPPDVAASFAQSYAFGNHTSLPQRVPTIEEIRAIADGALYRQQQQQTTTTRPGAPIPPTPPNNGLLYPPFVAAAAYPYLQPSISPPIPHATPYPFSYQHMMQQSQGQGQGQQSPAPDPHQMLQHLLGMQTDSTFSPSSTPYPTMTYDYSPFLPEHFRGRNINGNNNDPTMSMRSSPSHMPVNLPFFPINNARIRSKLNQKRQQRKTLKRTQSQRELARGLPPRGESTEPRETTPEPLDDGDDDDDGEQEGDEEEDELDDEQYHDVVDHSPRETTSSSTERGKGRRAGSAVVIKEDNGNAVPVHNEDDDNEQDANWIDDDDEDEDETGGLDVVLQHHHYHYESLPVYHPNSEKRRRRWEARWNELVKAFQNFDRETNSSMILMAAPARPSHSQPNGNNAANNTFYSIRSRSLRRTMSQTSSKQTDLRKLRTLFRNLATTRPPQLPPSSSPYHSSHSSQQHQRPVQTSHMSLVERFEHYSSSSSDTLDSETREEELRNTLGAALSTINALTNIYEGRDQRWVGEMGMRRDERERVDILLRQAFGFGLGGS